MSENSKYTDQEAFKFARTALNRGDTEVFISFIPQLKAHLDLQDKDGDTFLTCAVEMRDFDAVKALLDAGASVDIQNHKGSTALILATHNMQDKMFDTLIEHGADFTIKDKRGNCPFLIAAAFERKYIFDRLLSLGADIETFNNSGITPLIASTLNRRTDETYGMVDDLIDAKCNLDRQDNNGMTAIRHAVPKASNGAIVPLLNSGADCVLPDNDGSTPLISSVRVFNETAFVLLLPRYNTEDVNIQNNEGKTALIYAAACGYVKMFDHLISDGGADPHIKDNEGKTALYHAFENKRYNIAKRLIGQRAELSDSQIRHLSKEGHLGEFERYFQGVLSNSLRDAQQKVMKRTKRPRLM